ncbi:phosphoribosylamine--glycine ligase [Liquorilactobacillus vini]|uniref:phosphoribosylamine--glycine ligase n=1 Tax=Liquorilactobacillus vini TaxID=238015 RepID=UPI00029A35F0|nr:phosphoribosylamine--glycine ligase [Liquorilactobacillus vini]
MTASNLRILVIGSGGREHAIARKLLASPAVSEVYCAPGNPGMVATGIKLVPLGELAFDQLIEFAKKQNISWTFVGPEDALVAGIVDRFQAAGLKIFGPTAQAAQLEGSKKFALEFMKKYQIPTAHYQAYIDEQSALIGLSDLDLPVVIKADGLAAGKGVTIAQDRLTAQQAIKQVFEERKQQVVLEEFLAGDEYSLFVVIGQTNYQILPMAQDHKRVADHDHGPNTGGMGAYSPLPQLSTKLYQQMLTEVVEPTVAGLRQAEFNYHGVLYIGLIVTKKGPKVIEYNVRLGDPETQVVLPRIASDFAKLIDACVQNQPLPPVTFADFAAVAVVIAAQGYPQSPQIGQKLPVLAENKKIQIDYANVAGQVPAKLVANGGRLAAVIASQPDLLAAQKTAYDYLNSLNLTGCFYRHDIGQKATGKIFA